MPELKVVEAPKHANERVLERLEQAMDTVRAEPTCVGLAFVVIRADGSSFTGSTGTASRLVLQGAIYDMLHELSRQGYLDE